VAVGAMVAGTAKATTFNVGLSGTVVDFQSFSYDSGGIHFDQGVLPLNIVSFDHPLTVSQGDIINATITLDQPFTIPASVTLTSFIFGLGRTSSPSFPAVNTGTTGTTSFFNGVVPGPTGSASTTSSGWLPNSVVFFPPDNTAITFDSLTSNFKIDTLNESVTLDSALMYYELRSPVPIPAALWLLGSGLVGLVGLRRKFKM
jgi:hypothetical protein